MNKTTLEILEEILHSPNLYMLGEELVNNLALLYAKLWKEENENENCKKRRI